MGKRPPTGAGGRRRAEIAIPPQYWMQTPVAGSQYSNSSQ